MINQEDLYQHLYNKNWKEILDILYEEKENIKDDTLLTYASNIFVIEFLNKVENYEKEDKEILENLTTLNILHHGKFYILSNEQHKKLTIEIIKRKPLEEAFNYAKKYPEDDFCKKVIAEYNLLKAKERGSQQKYKKPKMQLSTELYNRIFELINDPEDDATYFSGPRFINTVRKFSPYHPTYTQYIEKRNEEGKSTSRKIFYYDILKELDENIREQVIKRILEMVRPFEADKVQQIENIIGGKPIEERKNINTEKEKVSDRPVVFISYSWDDEEHKEWVLKLAKRLAGDGVEVILDRFYLKPGANLQHFVENNLGRAHRVVIIFTPNYKLKADKRTGGVGFEYSIMNVELYNNITKNEKFIPLLRRGNMNESIPTFMQQFIHIDVTNDENIENSYNDLIREIYNEPEIKTPEIGSKPNFK
ncbi:toll/interleukin-1 receptor domain-containing protein [Chryseobacterium scophthalmum]|uniref:toll/interleukin-1 receptor domain-containing protein n=1 Tax=Chryseobacterium scophthalmum TaxID=59733 RepID=UPI001AEC3C62|nr:toll/interleukin-1 receptor domain-containing protein [Chryseobacterium scophthalmum]